MAAFNILRLTNSVKFTPLDIITYVVFVSLPLQTICITVAYYAEIDKSMVYYFKRK